MQHTRGMQHSRGKMIAFTEDSAWSVTGRSYVKRTEFITETLSHRHYTCMDTANHRIQSPPYVPRKFSDFNRVGEQLTNRNQKTHRENNMSMFWRKKERQNYILSLQKTAVCVKTSFRTWSFCIPFLSSQWPSACCNFSKARKIWIFSPLATSLLLIFI